MRVDLRAVVDQEADRVESAGSGDSDERSDAVSVSDVDLRALRHQVRNHFRLPEIGSLAASQGHAGQRVDSGILMTMSMLKQASSKSQLSSKLWLLEFEIVVRRKGCEKFE